MIPWGDGFVNEAMDGIGRTLGMDIYTLPDGRTVQVVGNNILVERIPVPTKSAGGVIIANPERSDATGLGIIRAVGHLVAKKTGANVPIYDVEPGMMCAFLWFHAERGTARQMQQCIGKNLIFLKWEDISFTWPADEPHTVSDIRSNST